MQNVNIRSLGLSVRVLFTGYLTVVALGYMMALIQILMTHGMADGKFGLSVDDIVYSYYGDRTGTLLETKLNGSMMDMVDTEERFFLIQWARDGATLENYESSGAKEIVQDYCVGCHNPDGPGPRNFEVDEEFLATTETDTGATLSALVRVSHIHIFGIAFVFMFVGLIFSLTTGLPKLVKSTLIAMPYVFLVGDIASWWITKYTPSAAWLVIFVGVGMALSFAIMWVWSFWQMWLAPKDSVTGSGWIDD